MAYVTDTVFNPFKDQVNAEMPRRLVFLTVAITGYDGDPNGFGAPAIITLAPVGSEYQQLTPATTWKRGPFGWYVLASTSMSMIPTVDNAYDVGAEAFRWREFFGARLSVIGRASLGGTETVDAAADGAAALGYVSATPSNAARVQAQAVGSVATGWAAVGGLGSGNEARIATFGTQGGFASGGVYTDGALSSVAVEASGGGHSFGRLSVFVGSGGYGEGLLTSSGGFATGYMTVIPGAFPNKTYGLINSDRSFSAGLLEASYDGYGYLRSSNGGAAIGRVAAIGTYVAELNASAPGSFAQGSARNGSVLATGIGSIARGTVRVEGASITASGFGAFASGVATYPYWFQYYPGYYAVPGNPVFIAVSGTGAFAHGATARYLSTDAHLTATATAAMAFGYAYDGFIEASNVATFVLGRTGTDGTVRGVSPGSLVVGRAYGGGILSGQGGILAGAANSGSLVQGGGLILGYGNGVGASTSVSGVMRVEVNGYGSYASGSGVGTMSASGGGIVSSTGGVVSTSAFGADAFVFGSGVAVTVGQAATPYGGVANGGALVASTPGRVTAGMTYAQNLTLSSYARVKNAWGIAQVFGDVGSGQAHVYGGYASSFHTGGWPFGQALADVTGGAVIVAEVRAVSRSIAFGFAHGTITGHASIRANGTGSLAGGYVRDQGYIDGLGAGSFAHGYMRGDGALQNSIRADGKGSGAFGNVVGAGRIQTGTLALGALAFGSVAGPVGEDPSIYAGGAGHLAFGRVASNGSIFSSSGGGALVFGDAGYNGVIQSIQGAGLAFGLARTYLSTAPYNARIRSRIGGFAHGQINQAQADAHIYALAGGFAHGSITYGGGLIRSSVGGIAFGHVAGNTTDIAWVRGDGLGAAAFGFAGGAYGASIIRASGFGSLAFGSSRSGYIHVPYGAHGSVAGGYVASFVVGASPNIRTGPYDHGAFAFGYVRATLVGSWYIQAEAKGAFAGGYAKDGSITASGPGSFAHGLVTSLGYMANPRIVAGGNGGSLVFGASQDGIISTYGAAYGALAGGSARATLVGPATGYIRAGSGAIAVGRALGVDYTSYIQALGHGSRAGGLAIDGGIVEAPITGYGGAAQGYVYGFGARISASGKGAFAFGSAQRASGPYFASIAASAWGAFAFGHVQGTADITASAYATLAGGYAYGGYSIAASAKGAFAFGATTTGSVVASAINATQFGPGTNALADSLKVGGTFRFKGTTGAPGTPADGDMWFGAGFTTLYVRLAGVTRSVNVT